RSSSWRARRGPEPRRPHSFPHPTARHQMRLPLPFACSFCYLAFLTDMELLGAALGAADGKSKDPPGEDEGGSFPGRPAGAAASKAELKASVLLSGPETADSANPGQRPRTLSGPFCHRGRRPSRDGALQVTDLLDPERLAAA